MTAPLLPEVHPGMDAPPRAQWQLAVKGRPSGVLPLLVRHGSARVNGEFAEARATSTRPQE